RELNLKQIEEISKIIEVECFVHGAMCVAVSGRCFTSQFLLNKSANRGECLQMCRRSYSIKDADGNELALENNKVMSAKDLCSLQFIEQLKKSGVKAFKIEGRNRSPEYVKVVVSIYRNALDKTLTKKEIDASMEKLKTVYNRGFSSGFYLGPPTDEDFSKTEYSEATEKKTCLGRVENYWPKVGAAAIKITSGHVKVGDEIYVIGKETGVIRVKVERIEVDHKPITDAKRGMIVAIKVSNCKRGDEVFLIEKC
ncbi:MAG: U32 family peptidase, partial [Candidatus Aenigmarchaeota archaeon]|nr:U32 family peptidase [Candidatus Aenigmarchaeota archaeon]